MASSQSLVRRAAPCGQISFLMAVHREQLCRVPAEVWSACVQAHISESVRLISLHGHEDHSLKG